MIISSASVLKRPSQFRANVFSFYHTKSTMASSNTVHRRSSKDEPPKMASSHDATLINPGPPAIYRLNTERTYIDGTDKKVRRWTYGRRDRNKKNKVILLVGETGAGKTTLINTMINYLLGVWFEDEDFYQITEEEEEEEHKDQSQSQTSYITVYEVFVEESPTSLTIIDTPGYADTKGFKREREISEYLRRLFSDEDGVHYIDAVCFVMKASQNRLSDKLLYIFHSVLSLFGRDIENNIVFIITHSDGGVPTDAINATNKAEIPCRRHEDNEPVHFLYNNRQKEIRNQRYEHVLKSAFEMGDESMNEFFKLLEENNRKSVQMTLNVLKERKQLEACVSNLREQFSKEELKIEELKQYQKAIKQKTDEIEKCRNTQFMVETIVKKKVPIENEWPWNNYATCCNVCKENCHEWGCLLAINVQSCEVIQNNHCTACTGKCHYSKHIRENKKYVTKTKYVTMTFDKLKQMKEHTGEQNVISFDNETYENTKKEYESNIKESENIRIKTNTLTKDLENFKQKNSYLLNEAYVSIVSLSLIALKSDSAFTLQHLDFLIDRLKEGQDEWKKKLQDLRKASVEEKNRGALRHVMKML